MQLTAAAGGAVGLGLLGGTREAPATVPRAGRSLRLLVLGGTGFTGPHQIEYALSRGHEVTTFNRGRTESTTHAEIFDRVEQLTGDRDSDLSALESGEWDAVIDNSASIPRWVRQTAELLRGRAELYLFTSSLSVHADFSVEGITEEHPVATIDDPTVEEITGETYGALKALCEAEARRAFPHGAIIVRPHLIVGPGDRSDRWTYWPVRIDRGGEVMAPGRPTNPTQYIDARDLAEFDIHLIEQRSVGTYSAVGPLSPLTMAELLYGMRAVVSNEISFTWVDADFLAENEVAPWRHMPAWIPPRGEMAGFASIDHRRAVAAGLRYRPLATTARDTLDWWKTLPEDRRANPRAGLPADRERDVLAAWLARQG